VEIGAEAALFPEKEYINGIAAAVWHTGDRRKKEKGQQGRREANKRQRRKAEM
jgi:hypothetical protein